VIFQYTQLDNSLAFIDLGLWITGVVVTYLIAIYTFLKFNSKKAEMEKYQKEIILTWVLFLVFLGIANTLNIIWRFGIADVDTAQFVEFLSQLFVYISFFTKILNIERGINRSKFYKGYYFSILELVSIIFGIVIYPIITEVGPIQTIYLILSIAGFAVFPIIFIYMTIKTTGATRTKSVLVVIGALFIGVGMVLQPQNVVEYIKALPDYEILLAFFTVLCPILIIIGIIFIFLSYRDTI
jgi:hypothetical protein